MKDHLFNMPDLARNSDETLSILAQQGDKTAYNTLCSRYIGCHETFALIAMPSALSILDEWTLGDTFVDCLMSSIEKYKVKAKASFKTFLVTLYRRSLAKEVNKYLNKVTVVSLDEENFYEDKISSYTLSDVIPSKENPTNSPIMFVDYGELKELVESMKLECEETLFKVIELLAEGYSLRDACAKLDYSYNKARYGIAVLKKRLANKDISIPKAGK